MLFGKKNTAVLISGRGSNIKSLIKYSKIKKSLIKIEKDLDEKILLEKVNKDKKILNFL